MPKSLLFFLYFYHFSFFYTLKTLISCGFLEWGLKNILETTGLGNPILYRE